MGNVSKGTGVVGNRNYIGRTKYAQAKYDFAVEGGAVSAITLTGDVVPNGALVTDAWFILDTAVTSGGAPTVSIGIETATDLRAAATLGTAPALDATLTPKRFTAFTSTSNPIKLTADRQVVATVATAALTAGVFRVVLAYVEVAA